ncbi:F0F1 ATP synthase subunit B [Candidatus Riflebacteria bacterium]
MALNIRLFKTFALFCLFTFISLTALWAGGGGGKSILHIDLRIISFQIINFLILLFALKVLLMEPIEDILQKRREKIERDLENAKKEHNIATALKLQYEGKIALVEEECYQMKLTAIRYSEEVKAHMMESIMDEGKAIKERVEKEIELEKEKARRELHDEAVGLSIALTTRILGREVKAADQKRLVDEFLNELA